MADGPADMKALLARRAAALGPSVRTFYDEPVHIVKGDGVWLWDAQGSKYLDCYNNVAHVGHCNPRVVEAICRQSATLNTHVRYVHEGIIEYVERLTATFDAALTSAILTCTGSEANDLALRMVQAATGKRGVIATDFTYHGNTAAVAQLSRSNIPGFGAGDHIRFVPAPDSYRPLGGEGGMPHAHAFAAAVAEQIKDLEDGPHGFAALIICPLFLNEGLPDLQAGWLKPAVEAVRAAGGMLIADEVQAGFGRTGTHMWAHQRHGIVPDVATLGKPMANGYPVGAVVAGEATMAAFSKTYRYFNTYGGNPVACAAAAAVLDEIEERKLMQNACSASERMCQRMADLAGAHPAIGDCRAFGLACAVELVIDRKNREPATELTDRVVNAMRERGVLLGMFGRARNILKIRPPMPFAPEDADLLFDTLDEVLAGMKQSA